LINSLHKTLKLFLTFALVTSGWTSILLISNSKFSSEINNIINKMYLNQKNFIFNVKDLSFLLIKDANDRLAGKP